MPKPLKKLINEWRSDLPITSTDLITGNEMARRLSAVQEENERLRTERDKWISRFSEISEPGSMGAFASRDMAWARIDAALALHQKREPEPIRLASIPFCSECDFDWPCPTVKALRD